jgi:hypothetical protein
MYPSQLRTTVPAVAAIIGSPGRITHIHMGCSSVRSIKKTVKNPIANGVSSRNATDMTGTIFCRK